ncbi:hypothetical protein ACQQ2Q_01670 [Agrobacterium sp. ES01]|uniref:hypothetical protein n=1 Tax=Agrobacterium sp. ES01 TaxID=3420714 RepID=UPI003D0BC197
MSSEQERKRTPRNFIASYDSEAPLEYQTRAVAFFDILGWGQAVEESESNSELRKILLNAVWSFVARTRDYVETETSDQPSRDEYSQFSDSLIISFPYSDYHDLFRLLKFVTEFQTSMLMLGLPIRGGVTVGPLFHMNAIAFGPALNCAYHLESKVAKMPRVIIDRALDFDVEAAASNLPRDWHFVLLADDGYYETDFLTGYARSEELAQIIQCKIDNWVEQHRNDEGILAKYLWLRARWNASRAM